MINKDFVYAVVGASNNEDKYGYKVLKDLIEAEFKVVPINPNEKKILNKKVYPALSQVKKKIDVVIFVVPPKVTEMVLKEIKNLNIKNVWMQPGSENENVINFCKMNGINYITNACIMIQKNKYLTN